MKIYALENRTTVSEMMTLFIRGVFRRAGRFRRDVSTPDPKVRGQDSSVRVFPAPHVAGHRVEMVIRPDKNPAEALERLRGIGDSFVSARENDLVLVHLHAEETEALKKKAMSIGEFLEWSDEKMTGDRENVEFQVEFPKKLPPDANRHRRGGFPDPGGCPKSGNRASVQLCDDRNRLHSGNPGATVRNLFFHFSQ